MAGQWGELSIETPHLFPLDGLLNNHLICFNLWLWREGFRWRGAGLALQPHLGGAPPPRSCPLHVSRQEAYERLAFKGRGRK